MPKKHNHPTAPAPEITTSSVGMVANRPIVEEMRESYLDYAMSVIVSRALPDVRDGLKPVHRRILYAMSQMGLKHTAKFRKSAAIVGEILGKYHPHGDTAVYDSMVRMAQDFSLRYPLVHGQGNWGCFTKDTEVKLTDGRNLSFEELVKEYEAGKKNYTFTVNSLGLVSIAEIRRPRMTIQNAELVQVTLDNGAEIRCTPNHRFMARDGSYKEAQNLQTGESLMPLYEKVSTTEDRLKREGYTLIYQNKKDEWVPIHHLADNYNLTHKRYRVQDGRVRHHKDFNKLNNNPDNVMRVEWGEHWKIHYSHASEQHKNPEYRAKIAEGRRAFWANPENRARESQQLSERNRMNWQKPEYHEMMRENLSRVNKEYIKNHPEKRLECAITGSKNMKLMWRDPKYRALFHEKIVASNKKRVTNNTGKLKFLIICRAVLDKYHHISQDLYETLRNQLYGYGRATTWETGIQKYYQNDPDLVLHELNKNHKVLSVKQLPSREDVYDLTIDDSHNFALAAGIFVHNSLDGDSAAAMRYTEAKMTPLAEELLADIEKNTVDFVPNYDGVHKEPVVLPSKVPQLLLNGTVGIAVGMATNIPPHNLGELVDATMHLVEHPDASVPDLLEYVKGPDFPTGGIIYGKKDLEAAYSTGRGGIVMRARAEMVEQKDGSYDIVVSEIPFQVNKATLVEKIADLVHEKKIEGIRDLRDESSKGEVRIVMELKKDAYPRKVLNSLFKMTQMQETFHFNTLALVDGIQPRVLNLKMMLEEFLKHREVVVRRRTEFDLDKAKQRAHILEGLKRAIDKIDAVIATIKKSKDRDQAKVNLMEKFKFTEAQAVAILEMRLQQLANLERQKVDDELKEKRELIKELESLLASRAKMLGVIKNELHELKKNFGDERRTEVVARGVKEFSIEDLVPNEQVIVLMTKDGYLKRVTEDTFRTQARGGKGVMGLTTKEEDEVEFMRSTNTHDDVFFFTNRGRVFQLKVYDIPQASRIAKGQAAINFLQLAPNEKVTALFTSDKLTDQKYLVMVTRHGVIKKTPIEDFANVRRSGLIALRIKEGDNLEWVRPSGGADDVMIVTAQGQSIRFSEKDVRPMGRTAAGVHGVRLHEKDEMIGMDVVGSKEKAHYDVFVVSENGLGKRTPLGEYKVQGRGGSGIKTMRITAKTGKIVSMKITEKDADEDVVVISVKGQVIRLPFKSVPRLGRATQGVRIMRFKEPDDTVASVTLL